MIIPRLARRNLFRCPRRVILSMVAIVVGIGVFILGEGLVSGVTENLKVSSIESMNSHVLIRPPDYPEGIQHPVDELLEIDEEVRRVLDEETVAWTERIIFSPTAAAGPDHVRARAIGYDPVRDPEVFSRALWQVTAEKPDAEQNEVLLTTGVADLLNLSVGDTLILRVRTHLGAMNALRVSVSGIVETGFHNIDSMGILMSLSLAQRLIDADNPTHIGTRLESRDDSEPFAARISELLGDRAEVQTWQEDVQDLMGIQNIRRRALQIISAILLALAGVGMANTILMSAYERVREVGTLRSMGMTKQGVTGLFVFEGLIIGIVGSILGALWGGGLAAHWAVNPIDFGDLIDVWGEDLAFSALVYTRFSMGTVLFGVGFGIVVSMLASIFPARVAASMPPAEAVRAE